MREKNIKIIRKEVLTVALKVIPVDDITKLDKQIKALKAILPRDNEKDREIHSRAIEALEKHREKLLRGI